MIRNYQTSDQDTVLDIWLQASIKAHYFVEPAFWHARLDDMRRLYIPAAENRVYVYDGEVIGFYSLNGDTLAAIFVYPHCQGQGIGKALLSDARARRAQLSLTVYQANTASCNFYLSQGFEVVKQQVDEYTGQCELLMRCTTAG